ncbi:prepilin-type N-terminal cleavage/methylation domain-containing protein [Zavarzinia sp. CC-PAN008]|uniref:prepilin-type N-terminal cleavage/methylation domain-containing protein n=1 Tax=Zavarzinia sp. CC-PAN008 TaxID=3243332 RepID=UPI003F74A07E
MTAARPGFTLLETLVVLVILGLLTTMLMQGFAQAMDLRLRLGTYMDGTGQATLSAAMVRGTLQGLVATAIPDDGSAEGRDAADAGAFTGSARLLRGQSLAALDGEIGTPSPIAWTLQREDGRTVLTYRGRTGTVQRIRAWAGDGGGFRFRDGAGRWHDIWPPPPVRPPARGAPGGEAAAQQQQQPEAALPSLIRLDGGAGDARWTILAAPRRTAPVEGAAPGGDAEAPPPGSITN